MAKKRQTDNSDISKAVVHLKPILGIEPGAYLTGIYAFLLIVILFLIFVLPGLTHWGSEIVVHTTPAGSAIYVDGRYDGATPKTIFVQGGSHDLSIRKPYYANVDQHLSVSGRLIGSLLFPRTVRVTASLSVADLNGLLASAFQDYSRWALVDKVVPNYQIPPILQSTVIGALESKGFSRPDILKQFLTGAMGDVTNEALMQDFMKAASALYASGKKLTPINVLTSVPDFTSLAAKYPDLPFWAVYSLPPAERTKAMESSWYREAAASYGQRMASFTATENPGTRAPLSIGGLQFIYVPGGRYIMGASVGAVPKDPSLANTDLPHIQSVPDFYMMSTEITHSEYARFVAANPEWAPDRATQLTGSGLATSDYLKGWIGDSSQVPQAYVSYYAAEAYCAWLTKQLPPALAGYTVTLPNEAEWEWAARMNVNPDRSVFHETATEEQPVGSGAPNTLGIRDLLGNVWEWNQDWFFPAAYFLVSADGTSSLEDGRIGKGAEVAVRGGSWASSRDSVTYTTRGSQPPTWCTPFLGFRPIIVKD